MPSRIGQSPLPRDEVQRLQDWPAPIVAYAADFHAGHDTGLHAHSRAQLVHADFGVMTVSAEAGTWLAPPGLAVWIPAGMQHRVRAVTDSRFATLYVRPEAAGPERGCRVVEVTPLLRALIQRAVGLPERIAPDGPEARLLEVVRDELAKLRQAPLHLPLPRDPRALAVAEALIADPADDRDADAWGRLAGASGRTLARLFHDETGMGFAAWRQRRRLLAALERLAAGEPVTTVALDLGYASPSAFTAMFRRALGQAPTRWLADAGRG
jgi:AraC-like DNA-binding protein